MSHVDDDAFERRTRELLDESAARLPAHVRSRLNQARQRALEEYAAREARPAWRRWLGMGGTGGTGGGVRRDDGSGGVSNRRGAWAIGLMPAGALAAVALIAVVLWTGRPGGLGSPSPQVLEAANGAGFEDIELLADADAEALALVAAGDPDFVEWAALATGEALGSGAGADGDGLMGGGEGGAQGA